MTEFYSVLEISGGSQLALIWKLQFGSNLLGNTIILQQLVGKGPDKVLEQILNLMLLENNPK